MVYGFTDIDGKIALPLTLTDVLDVRNA